MSEMQDFFKYRALALKYSMIQHSDFAHKAVDEAVEAGQVDFEMKNVCAKLSRQMVDEMDRVCENMGISKRRFVELAVSEAIQTADAALDPILDELQAEADRGVVTVQHA